MYQGRPSLRRWSASWVGLRTSLDQAAHGCRTGCATRCGSARRSGRASPRTSANSASPDAGGDRQHADPATSRLSATHSPSGTSTSDPSSFTSSASTTTTSTARHLRSTAAVHGHADEQPDERVGMEVLHVRPRTAGCSRYTTANRTTSHRDSSRLAGEQVHRKRAEADGQRLTKNRMPGAGNDPVERHEEDEDERPVVTHQVAAHQRDERRPEPRHQPNALVVQPEVVGRGAKPVVHVERAVREVGDVARDQGPHHPRRRPHREEPSGTVSIHSAAGRR